MTTLPVTGGCVCGAIRYECSQAPIAMLNCHCLDCQRSSGAPFASGFIVTESDLHITGTPKTFSVRTDNGSTVTRSFCAECGTPLFTRGENNPQFISVRFTTLDNTVEFQPMLDIWTASAQPWTCLNQDIPHYPQSP
ncbi:GFA family protein [Thiofilum flexile]|uniref:GFA family protein n=1 Tax=Thiofilum flexile TaxID=125627 RepID=UPI000377F333|nr:GFA family protein [Thiofilum flexile]